MKILNVAQIRKFDIANGPGIRVSLFASGCTHGCKNCFNAPYQDFKYGEPFDTSTEETMLKWLKNSIVSGLSVLGGEPLQQDNTLLSFLKRVKSEVNKSIWLYTGYVYEDIATQPNSLAYEIVKICDILIDGPFIETKKDLTLAYRGSSNQRIIDVQKTLLNNKLILWDDPRNAVKKERNF